MERVLPIQNDVWKHADGTEWIVIKTEVNTERHLEVTIAAMDYSFRIEKWNIEEFMDEVDAENYPDCKQKYVFELVREYKT